MRFNSQQSSPQNSTKGRKDENVLSGEDEEEDNVDELVSSTVQKKRITIVSKHTHNSDDENPDQSNADLQNDLKSKKLKKKKRNRSSQSTRFEKHEAPDNKNIFNKLHLEQILQKTMRLNIMKSDASCQTDPNFKMGPLSQNDESLTNWLKGEISKDFVGKRRE